MVKVTSLPSRTDEPEISLLIVRCDADLMVMLWLVSIRFAVADT